MNSLLLYFIITILEFITICFVKIEFIPILLIIYLFISAFIFINKKTNITKSYVIPIGFIALWLIFGTYINSINGKYIIIDHYRIIPILAILSMLFFVFGNIVGGYGKRIRFVPIIPKIKVIEHLHVMYIIIVISMIALLIYNVPIIKAIKNGDYFLNRIDMMFGRGYLASIGIIHSHLLPVVIILKRKMGIKVSLFDYFLVLLSFILIITPLNRGPILTFIITYMIIYNDFYKKLDVRKLAVFSIVVLVVFGSLVPLIRGNVNTIVTLLQNEIGIHIWNLSRYIKMSYITGFFGFLPYSMALSIVLPGHQEDFVIWIKQYSSINVPIGGASMSLIGEGYLAFGIFGVILSFALLGFLLRILEKNKTVSIGSYYLYIYFLNRSESIIQFGFSKVLLTLIILLLLMLVINRSYFENRNKGVVLNECNANK